MEVRCAFYQLRLSSLHLSDSMPVPFGLSRVHGARLSTLARAMFMKIASITPLRRAGPRCWLAIAIFAM